MNPIDIQPIIDGAAEAVSTHYLGGGGYRRWNAQDARATRSLGINEYGVADAVNILRSIRHDVPDSAATTETLRSLQNPETGLFTEPTHHPIHTTAHCSAALRLLDSRPAYRYTALEKYLDPAALAEFLDGLEWIGSPWDNSHKGAGIYAANVNAGSGTKEFENAYFAWLWDNADPLTGLWRKGCVGTGKVPVWHHMAGSFHYLFNHEYAHRPLRYPDKMIDTCIEMYGDPKFRTDFAMRCGFMEIDWVYCLTRAGRQTPHRDAERRAVLSGMEKLYVDYLMSLDFARDDGFNDLHMLFGVICALAELYTSLPGTLRADRPMLNVLDVRPFI